ncbi:hypothetical protein [Sorangium sp. So ce1000]|uniref:hypothetical protein n=1 Tax=Sorangium sp. So ce1000 TaxID=3133325 RepID=UPI003F5DF5CD
MGNARSSTVPATQGLKEKIRVSAVEGEVTHLVEDEEADLCTVLQSIVERPRRLLTSDVERELRDRDEEDRVAGEDGLLRDVLGDHRLAEPMGRDEHDVARTVEKGQTERGLDLVTVDVLGPRPIEVGHRRCTPRGNATQMWGSTPGGGWVIAEMI